MIDIKDKSKCCGCEACVQRCPKQCIALNEDCEGIRYPRVNLSLCINCGLCEKVCPVLHQDVSRKPLRAFAIRNMNEAIRKVSSSGGVFTALGEYVLRQHGVVFGARFDEQQNVMHDYTEEISGLSQFRGAKYAQSSIGNNYQKVEQFLKAGRMVLFTGLPCQVAGLKRYLGKDYAHLLAVDLFCHGVPSSGMWAYYLREKTRTDAGITPADVSHLSFRDKCTGWKTYSFTYTYKDDSGRVVTHSERASQNLFMKGFLSDLYLRPSCHECPAKNFSSGADLTIGDYWGVGQVHPNLDDDKGVSAVLVMTKKGAEVLAQLEELQSQETRIEDIIRFNPALIKSARIPRKRQDFFARVRMEGMESTIKALTYVSPFRRIMRNGRRILSFVYRKLFTYRK